MTLCALGWAIAAGLCGWFIVNPMLFPDEVPPHNRIFTNTGAEPLKIEVPPGGTVYLAVGRSGGGGR